MDYPSCPPEQETVATDTYFANVKGTNGVTCAQVYYGLLSHMINVYGLKSERDGPDSYEDFIRHEGAPQALRRDNARMQKGTRFTDLN